MGLCHKAGTEFLENEAKGLNKAIEQNDLRTAQTLMDEVNKAGGCYDSPEEVFKRLGPGAQDAVRLIENKQLPDGKVVPEALVFGPQS